MYISIHHNYYDSNSTGYFAMYNNTEESKELANRLSDCIKSNGQVPQRDNQLNTGYIGELNNINKSTTAVLLELGFFSNKEELEIICSDSYTDYVSTQIANELTKTLNQQYK
jgi:N-acetylmuramoyl-L-alanine amidase